MEAAANKLPIKLLEGVILATLVATAGTVLWQRQAIAEMGVSMRYMTEELVRLRLQITDLQLMSQRVSKLEVQMEATQEKLKEQGRMKDLR